MCEPRVALSLKDGTPCLQPITTEWTGAVGNGLWDDPANWTNGVPPFGAPYTADGQDVAIIDNSIDTTPFTVLITGSEGGQDLTLNATDPAGGTAVSLTGSLSLEYGGGGVRRPEPERGHLR